MNTLFEKIGSEKLQSLVADEYEKTKSIYTAVQNIAKELGFTSYGIFLNGKPVLGHVTHGGESMTVDFKQGV